MGERSVGRALVPWAAMLLALGLALAVGGWTIFERLDSLGDWPLVLLGAAVAGGLGCSGLLLVGGWPPERRVVLAALPAALPWLTGLAILRAHLRAMVLEDVDPGSLGLYVARELAEAGAGLFFGLLLSAALFAGITAGAAGAERGRGTAAGLSTVALGWVAATLACWHAVVVDAIHRIGDVEQARWTEVLTDAGALADPIALSGYGAGAALLIVAFALAARARDTRAMVAPVTATAATLALVVATAQVREAALAPAMTLMERPWNEPDFVATPTGGFWREPRERPLGVLGPSGLEVAGSHPGEAPEQALRRLVDEREAERERRLAQAVAEEETPAWMLEEPPREGAGQRAPVPRPPPEPPSLEQLAWSFGRFGGSFTRLCDPRGGGSVTLALDARVGAAELRGAIEALRRVGFDWLELSGPQERASEGLASIPLAERLVETRAWGLSVSIREACEPEQGVAFATGVIGAQPLEAVTLLGESVPLVNERMVTNWANAEAAVVLALADDASAESVVTSLSRLEDDVRFDDSEVYLFPSPAVAPQPRGRLSPGELERLAISFTAISIHGSMSEAEVTEALEATTPALRECYGAAFHLPAEPFRCQIFFTPGPTARAMVHGSGSWRLRECLTLALGRAAPGTDSNAASVVRFELNHRMRAE